MPVNGIGGVAATPFVPPTLDAKPVTGVGGGSEAGPVGKSFAAGLREVQDLQDKANAASAQLATGDLSDVHDFTTAAAKAQLGVSLTVALRNRAVEAYQEIMRMQV